MKIYKYVTGFIIILFLVFVLLKNDIVNFFIEQSNIILTHYSVSLFETISAILISVFFSLLIFFISLQFNLIRKISLNILVIFQTIPLIVISPLLLTMFGFSILVKIFVVSILGIYPILINIDKSYNDINEDYYLLFKLNNMNLYNTTKHLIIPSIFTSLFSGIKLTTSYAFSSIILTEFIGGQYGLGIYLARALKNFDEQAILAIVLLSIFTTFFLIQLVELIKQILINKIYGGLK